MALVALVQSLVVWLSECYDKGHPMTILRPWIVRENKWRACRNGLDAVVITSNTGDQRPLRESIPALLAELESYAHRLHCFAELQTVRRILQRGASYERQRVVHSDATGNELDRLGPNTNVFMCDQRGRWIGIVYGGNSCGVGSPIADRQAYRGPCKSGWVFDKYIELFAG